MNDLDSPLTAKQCIDTICEGDSNAKDPITYIVDFFLEQNEDEKLACVLSTLEELNLTGKVFTDFFYDFCKSDLNNLNMMIAAYHTGVFSNELFHEIIQNPAYDFQQLIICLQDYQEVLTECILERMIVPGDQDSVDFNDEYYEVLAPSVN